MLLRAYAAKTIIVELQRPSLPARLGGHKVLAYAAAGVTLSDCLTVCVLLGP